MSYAAFETSADAGQPVEFYRFTSGTRKWLYTSADAAQVYLTETYQPYPIKRAAFRQTQQMAKAELDINTPRDTPFVVDMLSSPLIDVVQLAIYRQHRADSEVIAYWQGRVSGIRLNGMEATISAGPRGTSLNGIGLHRPSQRLCPHALYGAGCQVVAASYAESGMLTSWVGATVTAGLFAGHADGWWTGGMVSLDGVRRLVIDHAGDTLTLIAPVPDLPQNASFVVYPGCNHSTDCDTKFSNTLNFGGARWFPLKNPYLGDSVF